MNRNELDPVQRVVLSLILLTGLLTIVANRHTLQTDVYRMANKPVRMMIMDDNSPIPILTSDLIVVVASANDLNQLICPDRTPLHVIPLDPKNPEHFRGLSPLDMEYVTQNPGLSYGDIGSQIRSGCAGVKIK